MFAYKITVTREEYKAITQERLIELYDKKVAAKEGSEEYENIRKEFNELVVKKLYFFIKNKYKNKKRTAVNSDEDFMSVGMSAIAEKLDAYDPHQTTPTTFFQSIILEYGRKFQSIDMSSHYHNAMIKLEKKLDEWDLPYSLKDDLPENMTIRLSKATDLSLTTIKETIAEIRRQPCALPEDYDNYTSDLKMLDPLKAYEQRESDENVANILGHSTLTSFERDVFLFTKYNPETAGSNRKAVLYFKQADIYAKYSDELKGKNINSQLITATATRAIEKIQADSKFQAMYKRNPNVIREKRYPVYEQEQVPVVEMASEEDIGNMMNSIIMEEI